MTDELHLRLMRGMYLRNNRQLRSVPNPRLERPQMSDTKDINAVIAALIEACEAARREAEKFADAWKRMVRKP